MLVFLLTVALLTSGCTGEGGTKIMVSDNNTEINISIPETSEESGLPAGSYIQVKNPITSTIYNMTVVGTEEFEGETLSKAVFETSSEKGTSKFEYMWSEDKNTTVWKKYDLEGNLSLEYVSREGNITISDGSGRKLEL
jgi:hypothetical protein